MAFGWLREPPAPGTSYKRLCELVMVSPGLRVGRGVVRELLFADPRLAASRRNFPGAVLGPAIPVGSEVAQPFGELDAPGQLRPRELDVAAVPGG